MATLSRLLGDTESCRDMGENFGGGLTRLEVDFLMAEEWATSVEDLYWRHSKAGLYASSVDRRRLAAYLKSKRTLAACPSPGAGSAAWAAGVCINR